MSIIYTVIGYESKMLSEYTGLQGNFSQICSKILPKIQAGTRGTMTYQDEYEFHFINSDNITYLTLVYKGYPKDVAFLFLESLQTEFTKTYPDTDFGNIPTRSLSEFDKKIQLFTEEYNDKKEEKESNIDVLKKNIVETKDILLQTEDILNERGEKMQLICKKADELSCHSDSFYSASKKVKKTALKRKIMIITGSIIGVLVVVYGVTAYVCGTMEVWKCSKS